MKSDERLIGGPDLRDLDGSTKESDALPLTKKRAVTRNRWRSSKRLSKKLASTQSTRAVPGVGKERFRWRDDRDCWMSCMSTPAVPQNRTHSGF
jgi:hypothetical protein